MATENSFLLSTDSLIRDHIPGFFRKNFFLYGSKLFSVLINIFLFCGFISFYNMNGFIELRCAKRLGSFWAQGLPTCLFGLHCQVVGGPVGVCHAGRLGLSPLGFCHLAQSHVTSCLGRCNSCFVSTTL